MRIREFQTLKFIDSHLGGRLLASEVEKTREKVLRGGQGTENERGKESFLIDLHSWLLRWKRIKQLSHLSTQ